MEDKPSPEEVAIHNKTHIPYRSWCPHCVRGRAMNDPHPKLVDREREVTTISIDFMYMTESQGERKARKKGDIQEDPKGMPILVMFDRKTRTPIAHVFR